MEENLMFPVDLDEYRSQLDKAASVRAAAVRRAELTTATLRALVVKAVAAGISQAEASRLAGVPRVTVRQWLGKK